MKTSELINDLQAQLGKPVLFNGGTMVMTRFEVNDNGPSHMGDLTCNFMLTSFIQEDKARLALPEGQEVILITDVESHNRNWQDGLAPLLVKGKLKRNKINDAAPQNVVQMIVVDKLGKVLVMHRSEKVRSAPNVWSFPTGMQEFGQSIVETAERELEEEYGLKAQKVALLGTYENVPGDGYHWVLNVMIVLVEDVSVAENKEPDKHDHMVFVDADFMLSDPVTFLESYEFHQSFSDWFMANLAEIQTKTLVFLSEARK
jgi:8-oxo-dGTP pyrophosphatase MutT (NUDIX family)